MEAVTASDQSPPRLPEKSRERIASMKRSVSHQNASITDKEAQPRAIQSADVSRAPSDSEQDEAFRDTSPARDTSPETSFHSPLTTWPTTERSSFDDDQATSWQNRPEVDADDAAQLAAAAAAAAAHRPDGASTTGTARQRHRSRPSTLFLPPLPDPSTFPMPPAGNASPSGSRISHGTPTQNGGANAATHYSSDMSSRFSSSTRASIWTQHSFSHQSAATSPSGGLSSRCASQSDLSHDVSAADRLPQYISVSPLPMSSVDDPLGLGIGVASEPETDVDGGLSRSNASDAGMSGLGTASTASPHSPHRRLSSSSKHKASARSSAAKSRPAVPPRCGSRQASTDSFPEAKSRNGSMASISSRLTNGTHDEIESISQGLAAAMSLRTSPSMSSLGSIGGHDGALSVSPRTSSLRNRAPSVSAVAGSTTTASMPARARGLQRSGSASSHTKPTRPLFHHRHQSSLSLAASRDVDAPPRLRLASATFDQRLMSSSSGSSSPVAAESATATKRWVEAAATSSSVTSSPGHGSSQPAELASEAEQAAPSNAILESAEEEDHFITSKALAAAEEHADGVVSLEGRNLAQLEAQLKPTATHLLLGGCREPGLADFLERSIARLSGSLLVLDVSYTGIRSLPRSLSRCSVLEELDISGNPLSGPGVTVIPQWISSLASLRVLVADEIGMHTLPHNLRCLHKLVQLSVRRNSITHLPGWLYTLKDLERLRIEGNAFNGPWDKIVAPLLRQQDSVVVAPPSDDAAATNLSPQRQSSGSQILAPPETPNSSSVDEREQLLAGEDRSPTTPSDTPSRPVSSAGSIGRSSKAMRPLMRRLRSNTDLSTAASQEPVPPLPQPSRPASPDGDVEMLASGGAGRTPGGSVSVDDTSTKSESRWGSTLLRKMARKGSYNTLRGMVQSNSTGSIAPQRSATALTASISSTKAEESGGGVFAAFAKATTPASSAANRKSGRSSAIKHHRKSFLRLDDPQFPAVPMTALGSASEGRETAGVPWPSDARPSSAEWTDHTRKLRALMQYLRDLDALCPSHATPRRDANAAPPTTAPPEMTRNVSASSVTSTASSLGLDLSRGSSTVLSPATCDTSISSHGGGGGEDANAATARPRDDAKDDSMRRLRIIREIISSEESYIRGLEDLVHIYVRPLRAIDATGAPFIPTAEHRAVFGNIEGLLQFHTGAFLPFLRDAAAPILAAEQDAAAEDAAMTARVAEEVGLVFNRHAAFFKMHSTYVNGLDHSLARVAQWSQATGPSSSATAAAAAAAASAVASPGADMSLVASMTPKERKKLKAMMQRARTDPRHTQLNVESYLLLPVQRIPRYRLFLEDLVRHTPCERLRDPESIRGALQAISTIATSINESKRQSEQDRKLLGWQARIRGKWPSPLVQPHRRLIKDGSLLLRRIVQRAPAFHTAAEGDPDDFVEDSSCSPCGPFVGLYQVDCLQQQCMDKRVTLLLCNDITVAVTDAGGSSGLVDLYAVLRVQSSKPVSIVGGNKLRVVDAKSVMYFEAGSRSEAEEWMNAINTVQQDQ